MRTILISNFIHAKAEIGKPVYSIRLNSLKTWVVFPRLLFPANSWKISPFIIISLYDSEIRATEPKIFRFRVGSLSFLFIGFTLHQQARCVIEMILKINKRRNHFFGFFLICPLNEMK